MLKIANSRVGTRKEVLIAKPMMTSAALGVICKMKELASGAVT